jgi:hypothetical protein
MLPMSFACRICPKNGSSAGELVGSMVSAPKYDSSFPVSFTSTHVCLRGTTLATEGRVPLREVQEVFGPQRHLVYNYVHLLRQPLIPGSCRRFRSHASGCFGRSGFLLVKSLHGSTVIAFSRLSLFCLADLPELRRLSIERSKVWSTLSMLP